MNSRKIIHFDDLVTLKEALTKLDEFLGDLNTEETIIVTVISDENGHVILDIQFIAMNLTDF